MSPPSMPCLSHQKCFTKTIVCLAVLPRLGVIVYVLTHFARGWLFTKGMELGILGRLLALGQGFNSPFGGSTGPTAFLAPGYPFVISILFRVFGIETVQSVIAILLMHVAFGVATVWLVMQIARKTVGVRAANLAGISWAFSPTLVWMPIIFWDTSASILLLTGMLALALRLAQSPSWTLWGVAGLYCGFAILINPSLFLALLAILGWVAFQTWEKRSLADFRSELLHRFAPFVALLILLGVFAPWPIRNWRELHAFIPFRSNLGYELWNGNQHGGSGRFVEALHPMLSLEQYREYAAAGEVEYMREKTALGEASIRAHPAEFLRTTAWRIPAFWLGLAQGGLETSSLVTLHASITSCLGLAGLSILWVRRRRLAWLFLLPLVIFPLPYYVTHPDFRFRLLLDPAVTILAAYAVTFAWELGSRRYVKSHLESQGLNRPLAGPSSKQ